MAYDETEMEMSDAESSDDESKDDGQETFLAPKSAFYGKDVKPGDRETVEAVHVYDDEIEWRCVKKDGDDEETEEETEGMGELTADA